MKKLGRKPILLTPEEKDFIDRNWRRLTYHEISDNLNHESIFRITKYCKEKGYNKKRKELTEGQKNFIRNNYLTMKESELMTATGLSRFFIQEFKREEGLAKLPANREKKESVQNVFFNVMEMDWVA
jgi:hypothetical protein